MHPSTLAGQQVLTFNDYFRLNIDIDIVVAHFGYTFSSARATLPRSEQPISWYQDLYDRLETSLPYVSLTSEAARREFLIAPIVLDLARFLHMKVKVEFPLDVSNQLKGFLDYYLQADQGLLIIEAKNADLQRGFTQLAVELIALDQWVDPKYPILYGIVSIGTIWQFGILDRSSKQITQDLALYRVPTDLRDLLAILLAILTEPERGS